VARFSSTRRSVDGVRRIHHRLDRLAQALRLIAVWKMEGYHNQEIAAKLGCVPRTVERKLVLIRTLWSQE
jgi:FixJ family two-component response regulator